MLTGVMVPIVDVSGHCKGGVKSIPKADRLLTNVKKITRPVRLKSRLGTGYQKSTQGRVLYTNSRGYASPFTHG